MRAICDDLEAEHAALDALVADLEAPRWDTPTPAEGWAVRDQIAHLAYSDVAARLAVSDAVAWAQECSLPRQERERRQRDAALGPAKLKIIRWVSGIAGDGAGSLSDLIMRTGQ